MSVCPEHACTHVSFPGLVQAKFLIVFQAKFLFLFRSPYNNESKQLLIYSFQVRNYLKLSCLSAAAIFNQRPVLSFGQYLNHQLSGDNHIH